MASLADLAPLESTVKIRGQEFPVYPLKLYQIASLLAKHKDLASAMDGADIPSAILKVGPAAVTDVIAAAMREDVRIVLKAGLTGVEEGRILIEAIELTLPEDEEEFADFMLALVAMLNRVGANKAGPESSNS